MADDKTDCIVAIKPCCNRIVFAAVNNARVMDAATRKDLAELVTLGCRVEHWTTEAVRNGDWGCKCEKKGNYDEVDSRSIPCKS